MDRITQSLLDEFVREYSLASLPHDKAFEHFAGYLMTSEHYAESFSTEDIVVGNGGDCGIDSITVIINGTLVTEPEEVEDLAETNKYLDVTFIFTQAERSTGFTAAKLGQFNYGVVDFFSSQPKLPRNEKVALFGRIWQAILERSRLFVKGNPQCYLYYVTTGKWTNDPVLAARREAAQQDIEELQLFRRVTFDCIDAGRLQKLYRESRNAITAEITFSQKTVIPDIPDVEQAYLGLLPATEFLKLVENESQEMNNGIFYDNVRHWQEWNPVNNEIRGTLSSPASKVLLPLLNNGVTIVARRINLTGNKFKIEDYQVVNGCQTSFVLHECRSMIDEKVLIPLRLIATEDERIKNSIIKATNRQTQVSEEQLFALSEFPKKLENFFPTFGVHKLYYERRSRQYNGLVGIEKVRIINMTILVRSFASMFLNLPHRTTRNYRALLEQIGTGIFNVEHRLEPYYVAAFAHYRLEYLFRTETIDAAFKPARYHLLMAFRLLVQPDNPPPMNSHETARYCTPIQEVLFDDTRCKDSFLSAAHNVMAIAAENLHRDNIRTEPFTSALVRRITG